MEIRHQLKSLFTQHWTYMAVSTACKLNLFDNLREAKTANQLAAELLLNEDKLFLLLCALHDKHFLDKEGNFFIVNSVSIFLIDKHPKSLKYACLNWSLEHLDAWQNLDYSIRTGKSSFEEIYGLPFFDYLSKKPEKLNDYHKAMYEYAKDDYKLLPSLVDFGKYKSVIDVGGGYGAVLENIKAKNPNIECILFDLEKVVKNVTFQDIKKIGGSFFNKIPKGAEAIILSRILHDWNNEKASIILQNSFEALPNGGALYMIENCVDKIKIDLSLLSLNMTVMCESYERTSIEYITLARKSGFSFDSEIKLNELQTILIFNK